jgi:uncharacterized membrane protein
MTDPSVAPTPSGPSVVPPLAGDEDRLVPAVVYGLYLVGTAVGVTTIIGLIVAYANIGAAGPVMRSHYIYQIRTFWLAIAWALAGLGFVLLGGLLLIVLIGFPILHMGIGILGLGWLWFLVRSLTGGVYLLQGIAYPRPRTWLI